MTDPQKTPRLADARVDESGLPWFALEDREDKATIRWAWGLAIALHFLLLLVQLPEMAAIEPPPPEKKKVYVVEQVRFKKPPPDKTPELPKPITTKVPIPDPTPDDPEPLRRVEEPPPEIELPTDMIVEIPDGPPPAPPSGPIRVGGDVQKPVKIYAPKPGYTEIARKARIEGIVVVEAIIDQRGDVVDAKILRGLPMGLDQQTLHAIRTWKFEPATLNGKPVDVYYTLTVTFGLQ